MPNLRRILGPGQGSELILRLFCPPLAKLCISDPRWIKLHTTVHFSAVFGQAPFFGACILTLWFQPLLTLRSLKECQPVLFMPPLTNKIGSVPTVFRLHHIISFMMPKPTMSTTASSSPQTTLSVFLCSTFWCSSASIRVLNAVLLCLVFDVHHLRQTKAFVLGLRYHSLKQARCSTS